MKPKIIYFLIVAFCFFLQTKKSLAEILPNDKFSSSDVVEFQLNSLQANLKDNRGIYQCWIFAHPENKKYTGPFENFAKMIQNNPYNVLLNSQFFKHKVLLENEKEARIEVILDSINKKRYKIYWSLGKANLNSKCKNCWMTLAVTQPYEIGTIY